MWPQILSFATTIIRPSIDYIYWRISSKISLEGSYVVSSGLFSIEYIKHLSKIFHTFTVREKMFNLKVLALIGCYKAKIEA